MTLLLEPGDVRVRGGLSDAGTSLARAAERIAYVGTSVTAQREGYRPRLHTALVDHFGHAHDAVNAGIGGVGSPTCNFLMEDLALAHAPALCFIETATGDMNGFVEADDVTASVDGMLHKLHRRGCPACLLHLYRRGEANAWDHPIVRRYEAVADAYAVPSIHVGAAIERGIGNGRLVQDAYVRDVVHLTPSGAALTADLIVHGLRMLMDAAHPPSAPVPPAPVGESYRHTRIAWAPALAGSDPGCQTPRFRLTYAYLDLGESHLATFQSEDADIKGLLIVAGAGADRVGLSAAGDLAVLDLDPWRTDYQRLSSVILPRAIAARTMITLQPRPALRLIGLLLRHADAEGCAGPHRDILTVRS